MSGYPDDDSLCNTDAQEAVLRLIARRSAPNASDAARALRARSAAARQLRLDRIIPAAVGDAEADWSEAERSLLLDHLTPAVTPAA